MSKLKTTGEINAWEAKVKQERAKRLRTVENNKRLQSALTAAQQRVETLEDALVKLVERCEHMLAESKDCGDPWAECPMQNAGKDWHLSGDLERAKKALKEQ